jgi:hypothetical protein
MSRLQLVARTEPAEYGWDVVGSARSNYRGSGWAALALGSRLALGAAASIFSNFLGPTGEPLVGLFFLPLAASRSG